MYGYYREKFHVNHLWELKGYNLQRNVSRAKFLSDRSTTEDVVTGNA